MTVQKVESFEMPGDKRYCCDGDKAMAVVGALSAKPVIELPAVDLFDDQTGMLNIGDLIKCELNVHADVNRRIEASDVDGALRLLLNLVVGGSSSCSAFKGDEKEQIGLGGFLGPAPSLPDFPMRIHQTSRDVEEYEAAHCGRGSCMSTDGTSFRRH